MLKILKGQEDAFRGVIVCEETSNASSLPLVLHFLSTALNANQKVVIVTSKFTETNYKLISSKAGIRWIPSNISFHKIFEPTESFNESVDLMMENVYKKVSESNASVVLFDDLSVLEQLGAKSVDVTVFVHRIYSLLQKVSSDSALVLAPFSVASQTTRLLRNRCHVFAQLTSVGHGFGKDASSKVVATVRTIGGLSTKKGILLSGERTINGAWVSV